MLLQRCERRIDARLGNLSALVCGASFAGLATAFWLARLGYAVTIVEVAKDLKKGGTPVDIKDGVIEVVKRMGLLDRIVSNSLNDRPMAFLDADGTPVAEMRANEREQGIIKSYEIERDALLDLLFREVNEGAEIVFNDSIARLEQSSEEVTVDFTSGKRRSFSLVLGCDGTHSTVRKLCFGEEARFSFFMQNYFGLSIVDKLLIPEDTGQMFNVPGKTVMLNAYNKKTDIAFCFFSEHEIAYDRRDLTQQRRMVEQHFEGEGWRVSELLEEMRLCNNFYFDKLCQIRMGSWSNGRVALVGDAAYCPSPTAGMGGSMAILGAAALADALQKYPDDFRQAFQEYDRSFRPIAEKIQSEAIEFGMEMVMPRTEEAIQRRNLQFVAAEC